MVAIKDIKIKCPNCRKSTNVYPSKLEGHYVCLTCCCIFMSKKKNGRTILTESIGHKKLLDFPYCHCGAKMK